MTLVFLYGPPAAGKLTVARELARLTGLRVLHNHLTNDLAHEIFPERNADFGDLVARLRLEVFEAAAKAGVSMISTFVYAYPQDDAFLAKIAAFYTDRGGKVAYVQLLPDSGDAPETDRRALTLGVSQAPGLAHPRRAARQERSRDRRPRQPDDRQLGRHRGDRGGRIAGWLDPAVLPSVSPS